ncbi:MAG: hypothetical protein WCR42_12455 [bacterium]
MKLIYRIIFLLLLLSSTIIIKDEPELAYFILGAVVVAYSLLLILRKNPEEAMFYKKSMVLTVDLFALMLMAPYLIISAFMSREGQMFDNLLLITLLGGFGIFLLIRAAWYDSLVVGFNEEGVIINSTYKKRIVKFSEIAKAQVVAQKHSGPSKLLLRSSGVANPVFIKHNFAEAKNVIPAVKVSLKDGKAFYVTLQMNNPSQLDFIDFFENKLIQQGIPIDDEVIDGKIKFFSTEFSTKPQRTFLMLVMTFFLFFIFVLLGTWGGMMYDTYKHPSVITNQQTTQDYWDYIKLAYSDNIIDKSVPGFGFPNIEFEINLANRNNCADIAIGSYIYVLLSQRSEIDPDKFIIVKLDKNGKVLKQKQVGSEAGDYAGTLRIVDQDNILLTGLSNPGSIGTKRATIFIRKMDKDLNTLWEKTIDEFTQYSFLEIFDVRFENDQNIELLLKADYSPAENFKAISSGEILKNTLLMKVGKSNEIVVLDKKRQYKSIKFNDNGMSGIINYKTYFEVTNFNKSGRILQDKKIPKAEYEYFKDMLICEDGSLALIGYNVTPSLEKSIIVMNMQKSGVINTKSLIGKSNVMGTSIVKTNDGYAILANPIVDPEGAQQGRYFNITQIDNSFKETYTRNFKKWDIEFTGLKMASFNNSLFILGDKYYIKGENGYDYKTLLKVKMK